MPQTGTTEMGTFSCSITADWPDSLDDARIDTAHQIVPEHEDGRPDGVLEVGAGLVVDDFVWWDVDSRSRAAWMTFGWPSDDLWMTFGCPSDDLGATSGRGRTSPRRRPPRRSRWALERLRHRESSEARVDSRDSVNKLNETDVLKSVSILS